MPLLGKRENKCKTASKKRFEVVNDTLNEIFIETATKIIYQHLEMNYQLKPENVAENVDTFKEGLEKFLSTGALAREGIIVKRLYRRFKIKYETRKDWTFADYIEDLKQKVESP
jgi:hypothetical protein